MNDQPAKLWCLFESGDRHAIAAQRCPNCSSSLVWMPIIDEEHQSKVGGRTRRMALNVWCRAVPEHLSFHLDGLAPDWAVEVPDWEQFNREEKNA